MGKELLFEIGTEEIPSGYLLPALEDLKAAAGRLLAEQRLTFTGIRTLGTPRRLTLFVDGLAERQADRRREVVGPPRAAAFDAEGAPTKAAEGFARGQGIPVSELEVRALDRGEYVVAVHEERGAAAREVLAEADMGAVAEGARPYGGHRGRGQDPRHRRTTFGARGSHRPA